MGKISFRNNTILSFVIFLHFIFIPLFFLRHSLKNKIFKKSDNVKANTKVKIKEDKLASKSNEDYEDEFENFENEDESKIKNIHY